MRSGDHREVIVPNSQIYGGIIVNVTAGDSRRIDLVFGIGYDDDTRSARQFIAGAMIQDARILQEPAPAISTS